MSRFRVSLGWLSCIVSIGFTATTHAGDPPGWPPVEPNPYTNTSVIVPTMIAGLIILIGLWRRRK